MAPTRRDRDQPACENSKSAKVELENKGNNNKIPMVDMKSTRISRHFALEKAELRLLN
jgi:hypothetical protein